MRYWSPWTLCLTSLFAGYLLGARGPEQLVTPANAVYGLNQTTDRAYEEMRARNVLQDGGQLLSKIAKLTVASVVHIQSERRSGKRGIIEETGSGVIVESTKVKGLFVITNQHVIEGAPPTNINIHLHDGRVIHPTQIVVDKATDVAVLRVSAPNLQPARWGNSDRVEMGHIVLAMGSPYGLSQSITFGIISAKGRRDLKLGETSDVLNQDFLQTDAAINPGNSGGPLIDITGEVIGINTAIASNSGGNEGVGFSIPSNLVKNVMEQLLENGKVLRAYLGVKLNPRFDLEAARRLKLDRPRGAHILEIYNDTPASRSGLQVDDVVLTFDGVEVLDQNHLIHLVSLTQVSRHVKTAIFRSGKHMTIDVTLADRAEFERRADANLDRPGTGTRVEPMGLTVHELDDELSTQLGYGRGARGLLVLDVERTGPLSRDVQQYDLIEEVARTPIATVSDLQNALRRPASGTGVPIKIRRRSGNQSQSHIVVMDR